MSDRPKMFFTGDVATLLEIPEWRVVKFAEGSEYELIPSHATAAGRGTRRVYDIEDVCLMALALRLLGVGLNSKRIGRILRILRRKERLSRFLEYAHDSEHLQQLYLLIFQRSKTGDLMVSEPALDVFLVSPFIEAQNQIGEHPNDDFLMLSVGSTFNMLKENLEDLPKERGQ